MSTGKIGLLLREVGRAARLEADLAATGKVLVNLGHQQPQVVGVTIRGEEIMVPREAVNVFLTDHACRTLANLRDLGVTVPEYEVWLDEATAEYFA